MSQNRKPMTTKEEQRKQLAEVMRKHTKMKETNPEYRKLSEERKKSLERLNLFNDSLPD